MPRRPMPWFRLYAETPSDRKVRRLKPEHRWLWICVLCQARTSPIPGMLMLSEREPCEPADLADLAGLTERSVVAGLDHMVQLGMLSRDGHLGALSVTAWADRQYASDTSTDRTRAHRERKKNDVGTFQRRHSDGGRNAPETETETDVTTTGTTGPRAAPPTSPDAAETPAPGTDLWARTLARQLPDMTATRARIALLTAHADHPDWPDADLVAHVAARGGAA